VSKQIEHIMGKNTYRFTGFLYLLVILFAGFSQGYVRTSLIVPGQAVETAANILQQEELFRLGLSLDLMAFILDAVISVLLYQLLRPFGKSLAMVAMVLRLIAHPAIASINLLNHYLALEVIGGAAFLGTFDQAQLQTLSLLFLEAHRYGYLIAGGFFGLHCLLLGMLIFRSHTIPNLLGALLCGAAAGYLVETFGNFSAPDYANYTALLVAVTAGIGEVAFALYLLIQGRKTDVQPKGFPGKA
jgi:hypothetical protein